MPTNPTTLDAFRHRTAKAMHLLLDDQTERRRTNMTKYTNSPDGGSAF